MPAYRRRGTYSSRRRRYTYRRRYPARRTYRRAYRYIPRPVNASQRSRTSVMFRIDAPFDVEVPVGSRDSAMAFLAPLVNNTGANALPNLCRINIIGNPLFDVYRGIYEQMKIDRVVWYITGITTIGVNGQQPALRVMTAIDRCFQTRDLYTANRWYPINILNASTGVDRVYTNNSRVKLARYCIASDMMERNSWCDTDIYYSTISAANTGFANDQNFQTSGIFQTGVSGFNPMLAVACQVADAVQQNPLPIRFFVQTLVTMSFRNPRGVSQSSTAKLEQAQKMAEEMKATQEPIKWEEFEQPDPVNVT